MKKWKSTLLLEMLEDRLTPSSSHPLWPDAAHLTLSFAPDGTNVSGAPSNLFATLNAVAPTASWETAILQAFQAWAGNSNINLGVVPDGGQLLGTSGAVQGDSRFGDIRIAAIPLPSGTVATTTFFSWTGSTWHGDMVLNSNCSFGLNGSGQYDLYTVVLHEAGHDFGFDDETTDSTSAMYTYYTGQRSGLSSADVANLQAEYGVRQPDSFNSKNLDNSFGSASVLPDGSGTTVNMAADLTTGAEFFKFQTPSKNDFTGFAFGVITNGVSLLVPKVTIYNASMQPIASAAAASPLNGNLTLQVSASHSTWYYLEVSPANSNFAIGNYQFFITNDFVTYVPPPPPPLPSYSFVNNLDQNNTTGNAIDLTNANNNMTNLRSNFLYRETINLPTDRDFFKVRAPSTSGSYTMSVVAWGAGMAPLDPIIHVYDAQGNPLPLQVLTNSGGTYAVQIANTTPNANYYVEVDPQQQAPANIGNYTVYANFSTTPPVALANLGSDTLSPSMTQDKASLAIAENQLFHFVLATSSSSTNMYVNMQVVDQNGNVVLNLNAYAGQPPATAMVYLQAGSYTVIYTAESQSGGQLSSVTYWLLGEDLSEPQGAYYTGGSSGSSSSYGYSGSSSGGSKPKTY
jgi:Matrixin